ncbi:putative short-chain dehydrogenase [Umbelopsis sp. PMI_123]|nr:putative short-chain dehydrogenase [Umbelopsis sp. PMI_123]
MADLYGLYAQFKTLPKPKGPFTDQIVIVTGSNSGIGVEAARHYANLDAKKVILAVRNLESGNDVKKSIEETTKCSGVVEVWKLDMSSSASVRAFADRVNKELPRLDVAALNAGIATLLFKQSNEGFEETLQVNVISTAYLAVLLLPKLYATADQFGVTPRLNITSSGVHVQKKLTKEMLVDGKPIAWLNTEKNVKKEMTHYQVSKLLEVFYVQELAKHIKTRENGQTKVIVNAIDPGLCHSNLVRNIENRAQLLFMQTFKAIFARSTEVGSRTIVNAGENDNFETHGKFLANCVVFPPSAHVRSKEGQDAQVKVWNELHDILYKIDPETASIV